MSNPRIIVVTGPTASGKSAFALELAEALGGEIVSADSMQVYRHLDIGTAKPSRRDRCRVPHHLIDVADPSESYHAGRFREEADLAIREIADRGGIPVVAGGTALYLKVLEHGLAAGPERDEPVRREIDARWERGGHLELWEELRRADPDLARRLHPNDRTRITRGLEVWRLTGERLSSLHAGHRFSQRRYSALRLALAVDRDALYRRIERRVVAMMDAGWVEEVRRVLAMGYSREIPPLQAIGYREICAHLFRGVDLETTVADIQRETRRLAKRQMTWFRRMSLEWVSPEDVAGALRLSKNFLQKPVGPI